jgi:hypothetical protein
VEYDVEEGPDGRTKAINVTGPSGSAPLVRRAVAGGRGAQRSEGPRSKQRSGGRGSRGWDRKRVPSRPQLSSGGGGQELWPP